MPSKGKALGVEQLRLTYEDQNLIMMLVLCPDKETEESEN